MTKEWPLLVRYTHGWGWGTWRGKTSTESTCLIARALGTPISEPDDDAERTRLGRRLTALEVGAISRVDFRRGSLWDAVIILRLAAQMGVEP